jgi:hypothetical protein
MWQDAPNGPPSSVCRLEAGQRPLGWEARGHLFERSAPMILGLPDTLRHLRSNTTLASYLPQRFGIILLIGGNDLQTFAGRPRLPVRTLTASSSGTTWTRSSPLAGVVRFAKGSPFPAVRVCLRMPLPLPPRAAPSPPPVPGGISAIHGAILSTHHPYMYQRL